MSFTTIISPFTAIDRIIARGFNPTQFISRAYRDHSYEWAQEFEALAYVNDCLTYGVSPRDTVDELSEKLSYPIETAVATLLKGHLRNCHEEWLVQLSEVVFSDTYNACGIDYDWNFTCSHNYQYSNLFEGTPSPDKENHSCCIVRKLSLSGNKYPTL